MVCAQCMTLVVDVDACFAFHTKCDDEAIRLHGGSIAESCLHAVQYDQVLIYVVYQVWVTLEIFNGDGSDSFSFHSMAVCFRSQSSEIKFVFCCSINSHECSIFP